MSSDRTPYGSPGLPQQRPEPTQRERIARVRTLLKRGLTYWKLTALILIVGCGLSVAVAMRVKLIYRSECVILFKPAMRTSERPDEDSPSERAGTLAPKLKEVLTTRSSLEQMIKEYGLYPRTVESKGMLEAVDEMRSHVGFRGRDSETFVVSYESESPEMAQKVTQRLADSMIEQFAKSSVGSAKQQADFLTAQESRSEAELEAANKSLATFLTVHPEFAVEAKGGSAFGPATGTGVVGAPGVQPQMGMLASLPKDPAAMGDPQLNVLYRQKARLEAEMRNNSGAGAPVVPGAPANASQIGQLTTARDEAAKAMAAAQADLADKRTKLTDAHPDVIAAKTSADIAARQLHQIEVQLAAAHQAAASGAPVAVDAPSVKGANPDLERRLATLNAQIGERRSLVSQQQKAQAPAVDGGAAIAAAGVTNELVELETEWQRLLRVLRDAKVQHDDLKGRLEHARLSASAAESSSGDQMQMLDTAYKPLKPSQGGRSKTALMGGVMTLLLALGYAFARVFSNDTLIDQADVDALEVIPVIGVLPKLRSGSNGIVPRAAQAARKPPSNPAPARAKEVRRAG